MVCTAPRCLFFSAVCFPVDVGPQQLPENRASCQESGVSIIVEYVLPREYDAFMRTLISQQYKLHALDRTFGCCPEI